MVTLVLMGGMLFFVLLFKDAFSDGIANFVNQVAPTTSDLQIPDVGGTPAASMQRGSRDD